MASIALTIAGNALGGPIGGALGGLLGSYIDNTFLFPALLGSPEAKPPQLGELSIQTVEEGAPSNVVIGPETRVTGNVIWSSDFVVEETEDEVGGSGGTEVVTGYNVFLDVAVGICHNEIQSITKIFAEGNVIYDAFPDKSASSASIYIRRESTTNMDITSPPGGPDLSVFRSGLDIDVAGFTNTANNGTFRVESSKKTPTGLSRVRVRNLLGTTAVAGPLITLYQTVPKFNVEKVQDIAIYLGTNSQNADPLIESYEGSGEVPGYRGIAYVVFQRLLLNDYGNRMPQISFVVKESTTMTSGEAIAKIVSRAKSSAVTVQTSEATRSLAGYPIRALIPTAQALQPVQVALNVLDQETDAGAIRFFDREKATIIDVPASKLGAVSGDGEKSGAVEVLPEPARVAPSEVHIGYLDSEADYQHGDQHQNRKLGHTLIEKLDFPLVLSGAGGEARQLARIILWLREAERRRFRLSLPPEYIYLLENDVIRVPVHGRIETMLIERADIGDNYMLELECVIDNREVLLQIAEADTPNAGGGEVKTPANVKVIPIDASFGMTPGPIPGPGYPGGGPTGGGLADRPGYGLILLKTDDEDEWFGGAIYQCVGPDDTGDYNRILTVANEATAGRAHTALGNATGGIWDYMNTLEVELFHGTLSSHTEDEVLAGYNRAYVGGEVIGFTTATLTDVNTYTISGFLRGLRDTKLAMGSHADYEDFVLLNGGGISLIEIPVSRIGVDFYLKGLSFGQGLDDVDSETINITAKNLIPFSPTDVEAEWVTGDDVFVTWNRRTREMCRLFGPKPLAEAFERYEIDLAPDGGDVVITKVVDDARTVTFTAAEMAEFDIDPGDTVDIYAYQISDIVGRSLAATTSASGAAA